jgi:hypothetical protein
VQANPGETDKSPTWRGSHFSALLLLFCCERQPMNSDMMKMTRIMSQVPLDPTKVLFVVDCNSAEGKGLH